MNLPILCALLSLGLVDTPAESFSTERDVPTTLSQSFELPPLVDQSFVNDVISTKGSPALFLATDGDGQFSPIAAEPIADDDLEAKVRDLVRREIQAGRLLFDATKLAELEARGALLVEWLDQGRLPASDQVDQLEERVNELEERVTEHLARDYRILVYDTFGKDREEFNHRRALWKLIDERWTKFEHTTQRRANLNQWLAEAIEVSQPGAETPLPPAPAWYYEPAEVLAQQDALGDELASANDQGDPFDVSSSDNFVGSPFDSAETPDNPSDDSLPQQQADGPFSDLENSDSFVPQDATLQDDAPQPDSDRGDSDRGDTGPSVDSLPNDFDSALAPSLPDNQTRLDGDEQPESTPDANRAVVDLSGFDEEDSADQPRERAVVNRELLTARVAGHNLAILQLADELGRRDRWSADTLAPHVDRLIDLHERRGDLVVFVELLEPPQRREFEQMETTRQVVTLLAEKIVGARLWAMGDDFGGNSQQRQAELAALAGFSRRLAEIAFDSPNPSGAEIR